MSDLSHDAEENIRTRAYLLWEAKAAQEAGSDDYWFLAKQLIEAEHHAAYKPLQALGHRSLPGLPKKGAARSPRLARANAPKDMHA